MGQQLVGAAHKYNRMMQHGPELRSASAVQGAGKVPSRWASLERYHTMDSETQEFSCQITQASVNLMM